MSINKQKLTDSQKILAYLGFVLGKMYSNQQISVGNDGVLM